jgi:hypothetical protein
MENNNETLPIWLVDEMIAYLYMNGSKIRKPDLVSVVHSPIVLFPTPVILSIT